MKRQQMDGRRFESIQCAVTFSATHSIDIGFGRQALPGAIIASEEGDATEFGRRIPHLWADYNGVPLIEDAPRMKDVPHNIFRSFSRARIQTSRPSREESWRLEYVRRPYLATLNESELFERGRFTLAAYGDAFFTEPDPDVPLGRKLLLQFPLVHFLEEVNRRHLDMRELRLDRPVSPEYSRPIYRRCGLPAAGNFYSDPATGFNFGCREAAQGELVLDLIEAYHIGSGLPLPMVTSPSCALRDLLEVVSEGERFRLWLVGRHLHW